MSTPSESTNQAALDILAKLRFEVSLKASTDADFHDAFLADPQSALASAFNLPEAALSNLKIQTFVESPGAVGIPIPSRKIAEEAVGGVAFDPAVAALSDRSNQFAALLDR